MKAKFIDGSNRPADFPLSKWPKVGQMYNITRIDRLHMQNKRLGVQVAEFDTESEPLYKYYAIERWEILDPTDISLLNMDAEIEELFKELDEPVREPSLFDHQ